MNQFYTPALLITEYYDSLISQLDIYTEETIKEYKEKGLTVKTSLFKSNISKKRCNVRNVKINETYGVETINNPYDSRKYTIERTDISEITDISQAEEYMNKMRQKAIDEIRKVQDENLDNYNVNKEKFKVDRENLTEEKLEELKSQLFANRFCFFLKKPKYESKDSPLFNLHTVITDFYLRESDIDYLRNEINEGNNASTKFDKRFLVVNQLKKYIVETLNGVLNGYEIIQIKQKTLFDIQHIEVESNINEFRFKEINSSFDMYLAAIKSLSIKPHKAIVNDLSAFVNLEYLLIWKIKLCQSPFQNLRKLTKLQIYNCDLSEFDFDSLNSLTSLQIIEIDKTNIFETFKIDLSRLINLKCFDISSVNLSDQISSQWFNCMSNLIELNLSFTNLRNVDFLDTDRLVNLEKLNLSNNKIRILRKGTFSKHKKLKMLDLSSNRIKELVPGVFEGLECLEHLDISSNRFNVESIDKTVFDELNCLNSLFIRDGLTYESNVDYLKRDGLNVY